MNKIDLIIDALQKLDNQAHVDDMDLITKALAAARKLKALKPVACVCKEITTLGVVHRLNEPCFHYTAPPRKEWVGLTEHEIWECQKPGLSDDVYKLIEAKLREKNT